MVWTAPITWEDGDPLTAAQLNNFVRNNFLETEVSKATTASRLITTAGMNAVREQQWARGFSSNVVTTTAQFPTIDDSEDDTEFGPIVTVEHGGRLLVMYDAMILVASGAAEALYGPVLNGRLPDSSMNAVMSGRSTYSRCGAWTLMEAEPGLATITMAYGVSGSESTARYSLRRLTVLPF